jgi:hypothetical protein
MAHQLQRLEDFCVDFVHASRHAVLDVTGQDSTSKGEPVENSHNRICTYTERRRKPQSQSRSAARPHDKAAHVWCATQAGHRGRFEAVGGLIANTTKTSGTSRHSYRAASTSAGGCLWVDQELGGYRRR